MEYAKIDSLTELAKDAKAWRASYGDATLMQVIGTITGANAKEVQEGHFEATALHHGAVPCTTARCRKSNAEKVYTHKEVCVVHKKDGTVSVAVNGKIVKPKTVKVEKTAKKSCLKHDKKTGCFCVKHEIKRFQITPTKRLVKVYEGDTLVSTRIELKFGNEWK